MFWKCTHVQHFWNAFNDLVTEKCVTARNVRLTESFVLLGFDDAIYVDNIFYFITLLAKYYVCTCKLKGNIPDLPQFLRILNDRYTIDEHNAYINSTYCDVSGMWMTYKSLFSAS